MGRAVESTALKLPGFQTKQGTLFDQVFRDLQAQSAKLVPPRKALTPSVARAVLPYLFIQEVVDPETVIMRLIGTVILSRNGVNATGRNLYELMPPDMRRMSWLHLRRLLDTPCGSRMICTESYDNREVVTEMVSFPFADASDLPRFVIAASAEVDLQELAARGDSTKKFGEVLSMEYIDIGAGA